MTQNNETKQELLLEAWRPLLETHGDDLPAIENRNQALVTAQLLQNQTDYMKANPDVYGPNVFDPLEEAIGTAGVFTGYGASDPVFNDPNASIDDCRPCVGQFGNSVCPTNNDFYARGDARIPSAIMPMIRRTYPQLLANKIVGIQPMNGPLGYATAIRFKYDNENFAAFTPDGGSTLNPPASSFENRSNGQEAGYNFLNTGHSGTLSPALTGLGVEGTDTSGSCFDFIAEDGGVAELLKNVECSTSCAQMSMCIEKQSVEAGSRCLAIKYSNELDEDLKNMYGISVGDEMTNAMTYELQAEIDREILMRMLQIALKAKQYSIWNPAEADGRWQGERNVTLWQHIMIEAQLMQTRNRLGAANFAVVTPTVAAMLQSLPNFTTFKVDANVMNKSGHSEAGSIGNIRVYVDSRTEAQFQSNIRGTRVDYILLGYKGSSPTETGLVYLPYIPVQKYETRGTHDFAPRIGLRTRYALATNLFGAENFYHVIILKGLRDCMTGDCTRAIF